MEGLLRAQSRQISDLEDQMEGNEAANYKMIQRFLKKEALQEVLQHPFNEEGYPTSEVLKEVGLKELINF